MEMDIIQTVKEKLGNKIIKFSEKNEKRYYLTVDSREILEVSKIFVKGLDFRFIIATGIDTPEGIEILYHYSDDKTGKIFTVGILIKDKNKPEVESISSLMKSAEWIEREIWELLGVNFTGHPGLKHLLLAEDWPEGEYPLRQKTKNGKR